MPFPFPCVCEVRVMPIDLRIECVAPGTCGWCQKQRDEVFTIAFGDKSFVGTLCKNDLLRPCG